MQKTIFYIEKVKTILSDMVHLLFKFLDVINYYNFRKNFQSPLGLHFSFIQVKIISDGKWKRKDLLYNCFIKKSMILMNVE